MSKRMKTVKVTARIFHGRYVDGREPKVIIEFWMAGGMYRTSKMLFAEANKIGILLYDKGFLFVPWLGKLFGWSAYSPRDASETEIIK